MSSGSSSNASDVDLPPPPPRPHYENQCTGCDSNRWQVTTTSTRDDFWAVMFQVCAKTAALRARAVVSTCHHSPLPSSLTLTLTAALITEGCLNHALISQHSTRTSCEMLPPCIQDATWAVMPEADIDVSENGGMVRLSFQYFSTVSMAAAQTLDVGFQKLLASCTRLVHTPRAHASCATPPFAAACAH